jgi:hypothetical protein
VLRLFSRKFYRLSRQLKARNTTHTFPNWYTEHFKIISKKGLTFLPRDTQKSLIVLQNVVFQRILLLQRTIKHEYNVKMYLNKSREQKLSWEAKSSSVIQEIPCSIRITTVHVVFKTPRHSALLSDRWTESILRTYLNEFHLNIIPQHLRLQDFPTKNLHVLHSHAYHMPRTFYPPWSDHLY